MNMIATITKRPKWSNSALVPRESPVVPKALATSKAMSRNFERCDSVSRNTPMNTTTRLIATSATNLRT
jgi:hypothetical protein